MRRFNATFFYYYKGRYKQHNMFNEPEALVMAYYKLFKYCPAFKYHGHNITEIKPEDEKRVIQRDSKDIGKKDNVYARFQK